MLPLLVLLFFSCPVKRALNPSFSTSALALQNGNHFNKKATSFAFVNTTLCSSADKVIEKSIVFPQQQENPWFSLFLPASDLFEAHYTIDKEKPFIISSSSYSYFSVSLFIKNRSLLI